MISKDRVLKLTYNGGELDELETKSVLSNNGGEYKLDEFSVFADNGTFEGNIWLPIGQSKMALWKE